MASFLEGQMSKAIYGGFRGKLLRGRLFRRVSETTVTLDENNRPISPTPLSWTMEGFTDQYSEFSRNTAKIPLGDLKVNIFGQSLDKGKVTPAQDDVAMFRKNGADSYYQIRPSIDTDPATAMWICQAFPIDKPAWIP